MCGFVGFCDKKEKKDKDKIIRKMAERIVHRGPDSDGYYSNNKIALGFRRLLFNPYAVHTDSFVQKEPQSLGRGR